MKIKQFNFPLLIILAGILFSLYLQWQNPEGVFFSGDAGLKALLAQQLGSGQLQFDLIPPPQNWIQNLWSNGFYPFEEPFAYHLNNRYWLTFPYTFPLVSAPFYALFGYRGLYIIPLVSIWFLWLSFYWACRRLHLKTFTTSIALALLIFASHLTLYSAMYWEHTLATALAFHGFSLLFIPSHPQGFSKKDAVLSGILIGLAVWFRPEFLCLVALLIVLVYLASFHDFKPLNFISQKVNLKKLRYLSQNREIFVISMLVTIGLFFLSNKIIYNHPLGIHAIQVVEKQTLSERLLVAWNNFSQLLLAPKSEVFLFQYLPITIFPIFYIPIALLSKNKVKFNIKLAVIYGLCFLFIVGVALMVPAGAGGKQWGPRFLLILVPIISLIAAKELQVILIKARPALKYSCLAIVSLLFVYGLYQNTTVGTTFLNKNNQGISQAIQFLQKDPNKFIGMSHQYVAQVLEPSISREKVFFRAEDSNKLVKLAQTLVNEGTQTFTYVCYRERDCQPPKDPASKLTFTKGNQSFTIKLSNLGKFGRYPIYKASIVKNPAAKPS